MIAYLDVQIADAIQLKGLAKKWDVDGKKKRGPKPRKHKLSDELAKAQRENEQLKKLVSTVRSWSYAQRVAVVDEVEYLQRSTSTRS